MIRIARIPFSTVLLLLLSAGAGPLASAQTCNEIVQDQNSLRFYHKHKAFNTTRDLEGSAGYSGNLSPQFLTDLDALGPDDVWMDSGGGEGRAVETYLGRAPKKKIAQVLMVSFATPLESAPGLRVLKGQLLENIPLAELGTVSLISDLYGPYAYASRLPQVLWTYLRILKKGGKIYLAMLDKEMLEDSRLLTGDGKWVTPMEFLRSLPGTEVERIPTGVGISAIRITKLEDAEWEAPEWRMLYHSRRAPPVRIWADSRWNAASAEAMRAHWEATRPAPPALNPFVAAGLLQLRFSPVSRTWLERILVERHPRRWAHFGGSALIGDQYAAMVERYQRDQRGWTTRMVRTVQGWSNRAAPRIRAFPEFVPVQAGRLEGEPRSFDLITDFGETILLNSGRPDRMLQHYLDLLRDDGVILIETDPPGAGKDMDTRIAVPSSNGGEGSQLTLFQWLQTIPGLKARKLEGVPVIELRILDRKWAKVPSLTFLSGLKVEPKSPRAAVFLQDRP